MKLPAILLALLAAVPSFAQQASEKEDLKKLPPLPFKEESVGNFAIRGGVNLSVKGFTSGTPLIIDEAFTTKHEGKPPSAPFRVLVPKDKDLLFTPGGKKTGAPELAKFMTATADKKAMEILRFVNLTVPLQPDAADRLKLCASLLKSQALGGVSKGYEKVAFLEAYATKVGGSDAVCIHAHMTSPGTGEHYAVKLVGILHPTQPGGVMAFLMANTKLSDIKDPADLTSKGVGLAIIHSVNFLDVPKK